MKFATNPIRQCPPHLRHVVTLPWEITNSNILQIFSRRGKNANKLHFKCTDVNLPTCVTVYVEYIYVLTEYLKHLSIRRHSYYCAALNAGQQRVK